MRFAIGRNQDLLKNKKLSGLLSSLGINTPLSQIPLVGSALGELRLQSKYKMNETVKKYLLAGDKIMPEM